MPDQFKDSVDALAGRILAQFQAVLGPRWKQFKDRDRVLLMACAKDAAFLVFAGLAGQPVEEERLQVDAQLANLKSTAVQAMHALFWQVVSTAVSTGLGIAGVALRSA